MFLFGKHLRCLRSKTTLSSLLDHTALPSKESFRRHESIGFSPIVTTLMAAGMVSFVGFEVTHSNRNADSNTAMCDGVKPSPDVLKNEIQRPEPPNKGSFLLTDSYRRRVFFKYERKLRSLSTPEKVFEYFASVKSPNGTTSMTALDVMRAVVPVFPPSESSLVREGSLAGEKSPGKIHSHPSQFFMLFDTNGDGLISFPEYYFLLTLLSIPEGSINSAVRMFDIDGNGTIDKDEFQKVYQAMKKRAMKGHRKYDGNRSCLKLEKNADSCGLVEYFFGKDGKKLLKLEDFKLFLRKLHEEMIWLEFSHYDYARKGTISAQDFGLSMVASADLSQLNNYLDRVDALGKDPAFQNYRITYEEFYNFAKLRKNLEPLEFAINSYGETYGLLTKSDFSRAANHVCKVPMSDQVIDIIFYVFDTDRDGNLSSNEFLGALERRERGVSQPVTDSGVLSFLSCWWDCARKCSE